MTHSDREIKDALVEAFPRMAPSKLTNYVYKMRNRELAAEANARDGYKLIGYFDAFCDQVDVRYFAIADTLAAAVTYHDFIPGSTKIEIGMLREDYVRFEEEYFGFLASCGFNRDGRTINVEDAPEDALPIRKSNPMGFVLECAVKGEGSSRLLLPSVVLCSRELVRVEGRILYSEEHMPYAADARIEISIFDAVPDDYDLSRVLFFAERTLNERYKTASIAEKTVLAEAIWRIGDSYNARPHEYVARLFPLRSKNAPLEDLFPTKRIAFGPVQIACPKRTNTWVYEDAESQKKQVAILQADAMRIVKEIDRICRKHGIGYFICGGTMLGLVRHGGFIPWDDDMDVGMLRADYQRFLEVASSEVQEDFFLQTRKSDPNIPYLFSKLRLKNSEYITAYNEFRDFEKGICVDIFPFDKTPFEYGLFDEHYENLKLLIREHNKVANRQVPKEGLPEMTELSPLETAGKLVMQSRHRFYWSKSLADTQAAYDEAVEQYNEDPNLHYVASYVPTFTMVHLDDLLPYRDVDFAGETLMAPAHPEVFLQMQYGDFMTLPMPHQQRGHGLLRWSDPEHSSDEFE